MHDFTLNPKLLKMIHLKVVPSGGLQPLRRKLSTPYPKSLSSNSQTLHPKAQTLQQERSTKVNFQVERGQSQPSGGVGLHGNAGDTGKHRATKNQKPEIKSQKKQKTENRKL